MTLLNWSEILNIGCPQVDTQHKRLISLSNDLIMAMAKDEGNCALEPLFNDLLEYTKTHFADEEQFMEGIAYPQLEAHKLAHKELADKVVAFKERLLNRTSVVPDEALDFVTDWIVEHIIKEDAQIGIFLRQKTTTVATHEGTS